jgi:hypothetical protein
MEQSTKKMLPSEKKKTSVINVKSVIISGTKRHDEWMQDVTLDIILSSVILPK